MYSDSHVHLEMYRKGELNGVIDRAKAAGLVLIITSGMDLKSSAEAVTIANTYDIVYANVGIHPWEAHEPLGDADQERFAELAEMSKVVAMGEIGLDYKAAASRENQIAVFRKLIQVGRVRNLPVVVHAREAHADMLQIFREERIWELGGIIHEFTPDESFVQECLEMGLYITAGKSINRLDRPDTSLLQKIIRDVPTERLVVETDAAPSYESDVGQKTQPADVLAVAHTVAGLKGVSAEEIGKVTVANLRRALHLGT